MRKRKPWWNYGHAYGALGTKMRKKTLFSKERSYGRANTRGYRSESGRAQHSGKSPYMAPQSDAGGGQVS